MKQVIFFKKTIKRCFLRRMAAGLYAAATLPGILADECGKHAGASGKKKGAFPDAAA